jgi:hypothetical protein
MQQDIFGFGLETKTRAHFPKTGFRNHHILRVVLLAGAVG